MDNTLGNCIADLLDNFDLDVLLSYADADDGAYTVYAYGSDFDVDTICDALIAIRDNVDLVRIIRDNMRIVSDNMSN